MNHQLLANERDTAERDADNRPNTINSAANIGMQEGIGQQGHTILDAAESAGPETCIHANNQGSTNWK
ncbi:MAG: hypothetical protein ACYCVD_12220 [Desulfitobacteriaceae bacterium]